MKITNSVTIQLTQEEAIKLAKILPSCEVFQGYDGYDENEEFSQILKEEICKQLGIKCYP